MSSSLLGFILYLSWGIFAAITAPLLPALLWWDQVTQPGHILGFIGAGLVIVYVAMSLSIAVMSIMQTLPTPMPLGPSFMQGSGLMTLMFMLPLLVVPGIIYLWMLPVDESGSLDRSRMFSFDPDAVPEPSHSL